MDGTDDGNAEAVGSSLGAKKIEESGECTWLVFILLNEELLSGSRTVGGGGKMDKPLLFPADCVSTGTVMRLLLVGASEAALFGSEFGTAVAVAVGSSVRI